MKTPGRTQPIALESSWIILDGRCLLIRCTVRILRRASTTCFQTWRPGSQRSASATTRNCRQAWMSGWSLRRQTSMTVELISLCTVMISASIWTATMLKNSLRLWLSNLNNKKCFFSLGFFLFQNVSYFLDSPCILHLLAMVLVVVQVLTFSNWSNWKFLSSGMSDGVTGWVVPDILNIHIAFTLLWGTPGGTFHKDESPIMKT